MSRRFLAQFNSICPECGDDIIADLDEITMTDAGAVHDDCGPSEPKPTTLPL